MNELSIFENSEFGAIRTIEENGKPYMGLFYLIEYGDKLLEKPQNPIRE